MTAIETTIIATKTLILLLGTAITYVAFKAYRRTGNSSLRALTVGFAVVTMGALFAGIAHQVFAVDLATGVLINSFLTVFGFAIIVYSLYIEQ